MRRLLCLATLLLTHSAHADPIEQYFGTGVLGIKWGTPLAEVQAKFPNGFTWETVKIFGTDFIHEARVDTDLFGLDSRDLPIHFRFDKAEKLIGVALHFPYDRKDDVLYQIAETLGQNYRASPTRLESRSSWPSQTKLRVTLLIGHSEPHKWAVLHVYSENSRNL